MFGTPTNNNNMYNSYSNINIKSPLPNINITSPSIFDTTRTPTQDIRTPTQDNIISNKNNELRTIYNERILQINNILLDICNNIGNDSLIHSLLNDDTSTGYLYAHLGEIMNKYLDDERETMFENISKRLSLTEYDLAKERNLSLQHKQQIQKMEIELNKRKEFEDKYLMISDKYNKLEKSFQDLAVKAQIETESLKNNITTLSLLNEETNKRLDDNQIILNHSNSDNKKLQHQLEESKNKSFLLGIIIIIITIVIINSNYHYNNYHYNHYHFNHHQKRKYYNVIMKYYYSKLLKIKN